MKIHAKHPDRNAEIAIFHESIYLSTARSFRPVDQGPSIDFVKPVGVTGIGVHSGQAGFFEQNNYPLGESTGDPNNKQSFFSMCRFITTQTQERAGIIAASPTTGCGVVSSSGWGVGVYPLYVAHDSNGDIIAAKIDFLVEEREDAFTGTNGTTDNDDNDNDDSGTVDMEIDEEDYQINA